jgi:hypothetical protein
MNVFPERIKQGGRSTLNVGTSPYDRLQGGRKEEKAQ